MKKFLFLLLGILLSSNAYAGIISYDSLSGDAGVSYSHFNSSFSKVYNEFNGNIDSTNIKTGGISEAADFAAAVSPVTRDAENIGDYTYTGMLPVTSATLTSNISAGTSYVNGYRVVTSTTSKTYTASKDTWVYIDQNGAFQYSEVANGAAQPTTPANSLLLAKVVTSGTAITSVTDSRQTTPPNLRVYSDLKSGLIISRDVSTATKITIDRGEIEFGSSVTSGKRRNTSSVTVDFTTTGRGGLDTGTLAPGYYYIHVVADDANATNYEGIASTSSTDATGVTGERYVGYCYATATDSISPDSVGSYRALGGDAPNIASRYDPTSKTVSSTLIAITPPLRMVTSGRPCKIDYSIVGLPGGDTGIIFSVSIDSATVLESEKYTELAHTAYEGGGNHSFIYKPTAGEHTFQLNAVRSGGSDITVKKINMMVEEK